MESMAATIGVSVPVSRFLLCFVVMIPVSFFHRFVLSPFGKHLYAALSGAFLSYLSSGFSSNLHFLVSMLLSYLTMVLLWSYCEILVFL
ncbi:hypothetical protein NC652_006563 [Populus alba x Populus x berolinensis]|uniref:Uncharacterized protein n=1 Tax=Populus alba x Populus x berolinensis TaxID=444605 RepID=A0AAD6WC87_9ROSI|nr:hypothetical protein NC652_006563 [Populus alba x Populus x berolinensis]KAJ7007463.1 hypothetical protein NC653_006486 [Populus alba x Populus x berolinensis]